MDQIIKKKLARNWFKTLQEVICQEIAVSYTHLRAHETDSYLVCRLLLEKKRSLNLASSVAIVLSENIRQSNIYGSNN